MKPISLSNINKPKMLAISIGLVYFFFGALKFFPQASPADQLAKDTITLLSMGLLSADISIILLALMETFIGVMLIARVALKPVIALAIFHIIMTFTPLLFFPDLSFSNAPYVPTLLGQYILKNLIIFCALLSIYPQNPQPQKNASMKMEQEERELVA